ncbi:MAG: hypothetical protein ACKOMX_07910 [Actinomycetota bacterium]
MRARQIIGLLLAIVALPFLVLGLIDPLEGGIALIVGLLLGVAVWLISKVPVPRFTWIALVPYRCRRADARADPSARGGRAGHDG